MVRTTIFKLAREPVNFSCRFCEASACSYVELLCHEIEEHFSHLSCSKCPDTVSAFLYHLKNEHQRILKEDELAHLHALTTCEPADPPTVTFVFEEKPDFTWDTSLRGSEFIVIVLLS